MYLIVLILITGALAFQFIGGELPQLKSNKTGVPVVIVTSPPQNAKSNLQLYTFLGITVTPSPTPTPIPTPISISISISIPTPTPPAPTPSLPTGMTPTAPISQTPSTTPNPGLGSSLKLTINQTKIDSTLTDFPVLVHLGASSGINSFNASAVFTELGSDANRKKISVTTATSTELYVEIEKWDTANKQAWLWVKVPSVSSTVDTILYLNYDKNRVDNTAYVGDIGSIPAKNVWSNGFIAVYHFSESGNGIAGEYIDSTGRGRNGQGGQGNAAAVPARVNSKIGYGQKYDGANDYISVPDHNDFSITTTCGFTIRTWYKPDVLSFNSGGESYIRWLGKGYTGGNWEWHFVVYNQPTSENLMRFYVYGPTGGLGAGDRIAGTSYLPIGTWKHVAATSTCSSPTIGNEQIYLDGSKANTGPDSWQSYSLNYANGAAPLNIGNARGSGYNNWFNGQMDELQISNVARSDAWIKASYSSENDGLITFNSL